VPCRNVLAGIVYVLRTGVPWRYVPGCGSGVTCWRRLVEWQQPGVWELLHQRLLERANRRRWAGLIGSEPGQHQRAGQALGELVGANPTDRGKPGSEYYLIVDGSGVPLAALVSAANTHDSRLLVPLVDRVGPVRGRVGRPRRRPERLCADKAYDFSRCRQALRERGISARIAHRKVQSSRRLGRQRWKVERIMAWLLEHRRLQVRYERLAAVLEGLLQLACALMCWRRLRILRGGV
jgi:transposase